MKEAPPRSWWKGLFGKYVISFVGLIVILLVVNGGLGSWFMYRDTTDLLVKAQSEKANATVQRIEQFVSEVERQISWATRASSATPDQRRADYTLLLPFIAIAMRHSGRNAGSTVAEVNLKFLSNFFDPDKVGKGNEAFVVGPGGAAARRFQLCAPPGHGPR